MDSIYYLARRTAIDHGMLIIILVNVNAELNFLNEGRKEEEKVFDECRAMESCYYYSEYDLISF